MRWAYPLVGLLLGIGNALGFATFRFLSLPGRGLYVTLSTAALLALAYWIGRRGDVLRAECTSDALTGLSNRRHFERCLQAELAQTARYQTPVALLMVDVDHFKAINDSRGHAAGDRALCVIGQCLRESCRVTDQASRWGGDEFAVIAPRTSVADATALARRICASVRSLSLRELAVARFSGHAAVPHFSVSIGIAVADYAHISLMRPEALFEAADAVLHAAKADGGDRVYSAGSNELDLAPPRPDPSAVPTNGPPSPRRAEPPGA